MTEDQKDLLEEARVFLGTLVLSVHNLFRL